MLPHRYDVVGSLLRPPSLVQARADFNAGKITSQDLHAAEQVEIKKIVAKQVELGLKAVTDGEFTRELWHIDFLAGFKGVERFMAPRGLDFVGVVTRADAVRVVDRIAYNPDHPFFEFWGYLKDALPSGVVGKVCIPGPSLLFGRGPSGIAPACYNGDNEAFLDDCATAYKKTIARFYELGVRYLQLDDCPLCAYAVWKPGNVPLTESEVAAGLELAELDVRCLNAALAGRPADLIVGLHTCRGNYASCYLATGPYDRVAPVLAKLEVDGLFLEYDDASRQGDFQCLEVLYKAMPKRRLVLGLLTSKFPALEDEDAVIARLQEAARYAPLDALCLSTQCGFASCDCGNKLTEEEQWAKLSHVVKIAKKVWSDA